MSKKILFIIGTRPELIKVFPLIKRLKEIDNSNFRVVSTGQHKELLESYWKVFDVQPDYELDIMIKNQSLSSLTGRVLIQLQGFIESIKGDFSPDVIVSQGDTTTVMASSMVSFFNNIEFAHIEAGLRSFNLNHPFPEEFNRKVSSIIASYHFAPTEVSKSNLVKEGISEDKIFVVGNTIVDTIQYFQKSSILKNHLFFNESLRDVQGSTVLVTCHRRENHENIGELIDSTKELAILHPNLTFIWPVHPNPRVYNKVLYSKLNDQPNIIITEPLEYLDLLKLISISEKIITDSGGIQEEAPSFSVPVLILRETTERPEAVDAGMSILVEMKSSAIIDAFCDFSPGSDLLEGHNPYGDGKTSERILKVLRVNGSSSYGI